MNRMSGWGGVTVLFVLATGAIWGQSVPTVEPAWALDKSSAGQRPTLAVISSVEDDPAQNSPSLGQNRRDLEDLLVMEMGNQPFLTLVDRQSLEAVMKEHAIALSSLMDANKAVTLGKFVGADYLLHVRVEKQMATIRLVEVATGQVKLEKQIALTDDIALSSAAIREKVLASLRPESQAVNRLTVGIAAFPNRSGTDRSDKFGIELQKALRKRLMERPWAVVLERQYPAALLEEVDLARLGLVRGSGVETLPPADLVILGTFEDIGRQYEAGKPWEVKLDLTLRLRGHSRQVHEKCRSDAVESAADRIMEAIDGLDRHPASGADVSEKELWRRQALYLMPRPMLSGYKQAIIPEFYDSTEMNQREVIRAWENVLLLDDKNAEAMTYLGVCGIGFSRWYYHGVNITGVERSTKSAQWVAASRFLERALEIEPTDERAATYLYCLKPMIDAVPTRAKEMALYVQGHAERFSRVPDSPWVKVALARSTPTNETGRFARLDGALANVAEDPNAVLILFAPGLTKGGPVQQYTALLNRYADSPDPVVQFVVHRAFGEMLCWARRDPAALEHFNKAIEVMEAAYAKCKSPHRESLNNIYRLKIEACQALGRPDEARTTAWAGVKHFKKAGRFDSCDHFNASSSWFYESNIGWLYQYCVAEGLQDGQEKEALALCDAYLAAAEPAWTLSAPWPRMAAKREELLARLEGKPRPDMSRLQSVAAWPSEMISYIDAGNAMRVPMAGMNGRLWFLSRPWGGLSMFGQGSMAEAPGVPKDNYHGVAVTSDAVFCGGRSGLFKLDLGGNLLKHYPHSSTCLPGNAVGNVCAADGKIYFSFHGSPRNGIAVLDPATEKVSVLAPSNHEATEKTEPVGDSASSIFWDSAARRLFVQTYFHRSYGSPVLTSVYTWPDATATWQRLPLHESPQFAVSDGNETLLARTAGAGTEFRFVKSGQKLTASVPVARLLGQPAWDEQHIWAPTASGLYEIDRATGRMIWLAYEDGNFFRSVLRSGDRLYIDTNRGLYFCDISSMAAAMAAHAKNPEAIMPATKGVAPEVAPVGFTAELSLEDDAKAEVTVQLERGRTLLKTMPGNVRIDLPAEGSGAQHVYFHCPGYASQWVYLKIDKGQASPERTKVTLFRKRYVVLRCSFNTSGQRHLEGDGVEEQRLALTQSTGPKYFNQDWRVRQRSNTGAMFGDTPYLNFHRYCTDFGFKKPPEGTSYEQMNEAPPSGYCCENIEAVKGLVLYCRVNGDSKEGMGYGKILVETITEKPPDDVQVLEKP